MRQRSNREADLSLDVGDLRRISAQQFGGIEGSLLDGLIRKRFEVGWDERSGKDLG